MFDIGQMDDFWTKLVATQTPSAEEQMFLAKLSRLGVKAPLGTPPAKEQLALALAKAKIGSGNFMGQPLDGVGAQEALKAKIMVDYNLPYFAAKKAVANHMGLR